MNTFSTSDAFEFARCRFLNADGAGTIRERLDPGMLLDALTWFCDPKGGDLGRALLRRAPLFVTGVDRLALVWDSDGDPQPYASGTNLFGLGLLAGSWVLARHEAGSPFGAEVGMREFLGALAVQTPIPMPPPSACAADSMQSFVHRLTKFDAGLDLTLEAACDLAINADSDRPGAFPLRYLFLLGALGAGIRPEPAWAGRRAADIQDMTHLTEAPGAGDDDG